MKNKVVPVALAQLLATAGFNEDCAQQYGNNTGHIYADHSAKNSELDYAAPHGTVAAPTWEQAFNWICEHRDTVKTERLLHTAFFNIV